MEWLKNKVRGWLGIRALSEQQKDLWWEIHDSSGIKKRLSQHENALGVLMEINAKPEEFTFDEISMIWQSKNWKKAKGVWYSGAYFRDKDYYKGLLEFSKDNRRDK